MHLIWSTGKAFQDIILFQELVEVSAYHSSFEHLITVWCSRGNTRQKLAFVMNLVDTGVVNIFLNAFIVKKRGLSASIYFFCILRSGCMLRLFWKLYVCFHMVLPT